MFQLGQLQQVILLVLFVEYQKMSVKLLSWEEAVVWLKSQPDKQQLVRDCYYDDPLEIAAERFSSSEEWSAVRQLIDSKKMGSVLDLGAGRGISSYAFAKAGFQVTALEPNPSSVVGAGAIMSLAEKSQQTIRIVQEFAEKLPFNDDSFDIVYGRAVLHHAQDLHIFCREVSRVLKQGGIFLATREHVISKSDDLGIFLQNHALHQLYGGECAYLLEDYCNAIKKAGLSIQRSISPSESVINYAPTTSIEFDQSIIDYLQKRFGKGIGGMLATSPRIRAWAARYLTYRADYPGRHYSFLAVKPS
jgi:ubiquinone/menaquinone biosynthesis C-methylase UbiE